MAVSQIEEKILGRLAQQLPQTSELNILLSSSLFRVLGLSIQLSKRLNKARQTRKLDFARETKSLRLYHHIVWLAREGLWMTEYDVLHNLQSNVQGPEYRVMAAKMRASLHHVLCLFDFRSSINSPSERFNELPEAGSSRPQRNVQSPTTTNIGLQHARSPTKRSPSGEVEGRTSKRREGKAALRDPILSITSDTSYVTNPYAPGARQTPPPALVPVIDEARRTPVLPPGLTPVKDDFNKSTNLTSPGNDVAIAARYFAQAQALADSLLAAPNAIRLSLTLEHSVFLWECAKEPERAQKLARRAIRAVYRSSDGLDDDEFKDASELVQALAGIVKRGQPQNSFHASGDSAPSPDQQHESRRARPLAIDRTIALSPMNIRNSHSQSPAQIRSKMRTPERLSTVPEVDSVAEEPQQFQKVATSPPLSSKATSRIPQWKNSSSTVASSSMEKASKRHLVEEAEQRLSRRNSLQSGGGSGGGATVNGLRSRPNSRQATPPDGISVPATATTPIAPSSSPSPPSRSSDPSNPKSVVPRTQHHPKAQQRQKERRKQNHPHDHQQKQRKQHRSMGSEKLVSSNDNDDDRSGGSRRENVQHRRHRRRGAAADDRHEAIRRTLSILSASATKSLGSEVGQSAPSHGNMKSSVRIV